MPSTVELIKITNIISACMMILIGVSQIISLAVILKSFSFSFFMRIFLPFFLIGFGVLLLASGQKMEFIANNFKFLTTFLGRGMFNIYLASLAVYQLSGESSEIIGFIIGAMLFGSGVFYIVLHFCKNDELTVYKEQLS